MYDGNPGEIDFGSSKRFDYRESTVDGIRGEWIASSMFFQRHFRCYLVLF